MSNLLNKFIHSRSGSAAVMVLSVILILTALGTVALLGSVSSIKMGTRYHNWSKEFYSLDTDAEQCVKEVDTLLKQAEQAARTYMEEEKYKLPGYTDPTMHMTTAVQTFFFDNCWMNQTGNSYDEFIARYITTTPSAISSMITADYKNELQTGYKECFEKLYFFYVSNLLNTYISGMSGLTNPPVIEKTNVISQLANPVSRTWATYQPIDILLGIRKIDPVDDKKSVEVEMKVINPEYKTIVQNAFVPVKGNPLWGYALAAGGGVAVSGTPANLIQVGGDIAAAGGNLSVQQNGKLNVFGNIYANGDVKVSGDSGELHVFDHNSADTLAPQSYGKKKGIYNQSELGVDQEDTNLFEAGLDGLVEPVTAAAITVPMFYCDLSLARWGNVYCKNLLIEDMVQSGNLVVDGNVTTSDDVEMNGLQSNTITIGGNYVGISSEGAYTTNAAVSLDPNASSTIFNNQVLNDTTGVNLNNHINLNGNIIVPGTVFRQFDGPSWYQTIESITGRDRSIFEAYVADPDDTAAEIYNLTSGSAIDIYAMKSLSSDLNIRRQDFTNTLSGSSITTNVFGTAGMTGYSLGAVVTQASGSTGASIYVPGSNPIGGSAAYTANQMNWNTAKGANKLHPYFDAKTKTFGFYNRPLGSLVESGAISQASIDAMAVVNMYYLNGSKTFDITGKNGIIYCSGDLTIKGTGIFKGIIIASGNITLNPVDGAFSIKYDESTVSSIITDEKAWAVRAFFQDGMIGHDDYAFTRNFNAAGATKSFMKRYSIMKWQEVQKPA